MKSGALQIYFQFFVSCCSYVSCLGQVNGWSSLPFTANSFETTFIVDVVVEKEAFVFYQNHQVISKFTSILPCCSSFTISCVRRWVHIDFEDWRDVTIFRWRIKFIGVSWTWFQFSCIFEAEPWHAWSRNVWKSAFQTQFSQQIRYQWRHWKSWWISHVWLICIWTLLSSWLWNLRSQIWKFGRASPCTRMVMIFLLWFPVTSLVCTTENQNLVYTTLVFSKYCDLHENCNFHLLSTLSTTRIF